MSSSVKYIKNDAGHYQCPHCDKTCEKQNTMYYHIKKNHSEDFKFTCPHCEESKHFVQKSAYLQHLASTHPDLAEEDNPYLTVEFKCPTCDHTAKTKANILVHYARTHARDWIPTFEKSAETKKCACKGCQKEFPSSTGYYYHAVGCGNLGPTPGVHVNALAQIK
jgi:hypothetical protein